MVNPWRGLAGLPRTSWILALATLVNRAGVMVRPFLVIYLTTQFKLPEERAGWYLFAYGATTLVAAPLSGRLTDRFGARAVMRICLLFSAGALLLYPLARTPLSLLGATIAFSLFNEMPRPALLTLVTEVVPPAKRKSAIVLSRLAINLGIGIGPAVAGFIVAPHLGAKEASLGQFRALFLIDAGANLAASLILWLTPLPRGEHAQVLPPARAGLLADPRLRVLFIATTLNAIVFWQFESSLSLYIKNHLRLTMTVAGYLFQPEKLYGLTISLNALMIVLLEVELNLLTQRWPQRRNLVVGALLVALGFGGMAIAHGVGMIALNVVLFTFGEMFLMPAVANYAISIAPPLRRGSYMGVVTLCYGVGYAIGPWLGTSLLALRGPVVLWCATLLVGIAAAWCYSRLDEPPPLDGKAEEGEVAAA